MSTKEDQLIILNAKTTVLPKGCAKEAWDRLLEKYEPMDHRTKMDSLNKFINTTLKITEDPRQWIESMNDIRTFLVDKCKVSLNDDEFVDRILENIPNERYSNM